jgi:DNA polymerase III alpha subunit
MYQALAKDVDSSESAIFLKVVAKGIARDLQGKKRLQAYYEKFAAGCAEKGMSKEATDQIWNDILAMTTYAFNRSHSAGYGLQAYQDAWLKKYHPLEFYNSLLSTEEKKIPQIIRESKAYAVKILPPDINTSGADFTIDGNAIRFGLRAVKGVADAGISAILANRPFESYEEFEKTVPARKCNSAARAALVSSGAFDSLGGRSDWTPGEKRKREREVLGFALDKDDPNKLKDFVDDRVHYVHELAEAAAKEEPVVVGGEVIKAVEHKTKRGNPYCKVELELDADVYHVKFWESEYNKFRHLLVEGNMILVNGSYNEEWDNVDARYAISAQQLKDAEAKEK